jgi:hypothetical protein
MTYKVPRHIWRTADGRLVSDGHLDAAFLAYPAGEEISDSVAEEKGLLGVYPSQEADVSTKAVTDHGDKAVTAHGDKSPAGLEEPKKSGSKPDWVEYAVSKGADRDEAEASNRDDLAAAYGTK